MFLQIAAEQTPFFANNLEGFLKVVGMIATFSAVVLGGIWKMISSRLTLENKKLRTDLTGLGERVNKIDAACISNEASTTAKIAELTRRADGKDIEIREVTGDIARLEAKVDQAIQQGTDNKLEIIGAFQVAANEIRTGQHAIELDFAKLTARLEERDRFQKELEQARRAS